MSKELRKMIRQILFEGDVYDITGRLPKRPEHPELTELKVCEAEFESIKNQIFELYNRTAELASVDFDDKDFHLRLGDLLEKIKGMMPKGKKRNDLSPSEMRFREMMKSTEYDKDY